MKFWVKRIFLFLVVVFFVFFVAKSWHILTGGFKTNKIIVPKDCEAEEYLNDSEKDFFSIFDQKYFYLDKGCQAYVFESEDKKYVIKFLRHHKYKPPFWLFLINFFEKGKIYKKKIEEYKKSRVKNAFKSYSMAYKDLMSETGILYVHLKRTNHIKRILCVADKLGQNKFLDLDKVHFVVQKKMHKLEKKLLDLHEKRDLHLAKIFLNNYFMLIKKRCSKKIKNVDHSGYIRNMGYINKRVYEIDVGGYRKRKELLTKEGFKVEFCYFSDRLKRWSKKRAPLFLSFIDERSKEILKEGVN